MIFVTNKAILHQKHSLLGKMCLPCRENFVREHWWICLCHVVLHYIYSFVYTHRRVSLQTQLLHASVDASCDQATDTARTTYQLNAKGH